MKNICYDNFVTTYYKRNVTGTSIFLKSLTRKIKFIPKPKKIKTFKRDLDNPAFSSI